MLSPSVLVPIMTAGELTQDSVNELLH